MIPTMNIGMKINKYNIMISKTINTQIYKIIKYNNKNVYQLNNIINVCKIQNRILIILMI